MEKKTTKLKRMLASPSLEFLMEAHNGLSAKIVEEAGFAGIWGSGLSISSALGVRDSNEASWTQVVEVVEFMSDATGIPILLDADTGYGNFNNVRRLVRKLEKLDVAGICIEDKLFPKSNSLLEGAPHPLVDPAEFVGKIKAAKDTQQDPDFCVVARTEALIAGRGLGEALYRASLYHDAGADGILVHSKASLPDQVLDFASEWKRPCPIIIVPTAYCTTPTSCFEEAGVAMVIWANHIMRAALRAMQEAAARIYREQSVAFVEEQIAPLKEVFRLQNMAELQRAEHTYMPPAGTCDDTLVQRLGVPS
jgi:phosphoenolpyruvate phosphomutase